MKKIIPAPKVNFLMKSLYSGVYLQLRIVALKPLILTTE